MEWGPPGIHGRIVGVPTRTCAVTRVATLLAALAIVAVAPEAAGAATVKATGSTITYDAEDSASPVENQLTVSRVTTTTPPATVYRFRDASSAPLVVHPESDQVPAPVCTPTSDPTAAGAIDCNVAAPATIVINTGGGNDTVSVTASPVATLTINGGDGGDNPLTVGAIAASGTAGSSGVVVNGEAGADVLSSAAVLSPGAPASSASTLSGGTEADTLTATATGPDILDGGDGVDTADYSARTAGVAVSLDDIAVDGAPGENDNVKATVENVNGGSKDDILSAPAGDTAAHVFNGNGGSDAMTSAGSGVATFNGGAGDDELGGGSGPDILDGGANDDQVSGGAGDDRLLQSATADGNDSLSGGAGAGDRVEYSTRTARVVVDIGAGVANDGDPAATERDDVQATVEQLTTGSGNDSVTGDLGGNTLSGGAGTDDLIGGDGADVLNGGGGIDSLSGGDGADQLNGDAENDGLKGGAGRDVLTGGAGTSDTADYSDHTQDVTAAIDASPNSGSSEDVDAGLKDTIAADVENITGGGGGDALTGSAGANILSGGSGDDSLKGLGGADTLNGGDGGDTADYSDHAASVTADIGGSAGGDGSTEDGAAGSRDTINPADVENIDGGTTGDFLTGSAGANVLDGNGGDDNLKGAAGADTLAGGPGTSDTADYSDHTQLVVAGLPGGAGEDGGAEDGPANGRDSIDPTDVENIAGGGGNDQLTGDAGNNALTGNGGHDTLIGAAGGDQLLGGAGASDTADYSDHVQNVTAGIGGAAGDDGSPEDGSAGNRDTIDPATVENITGGNGDDGLSGDGNANVLSGGDGADQLSGGGSGDRLLGGAGMDGLVASTGDDTLEGGDGPDSLDGGAGTDDLTGGAGADGLVGGAGTSDTALYSDHLSRVVVDLGGAAGNDGGAEDGPAGLRDTVDPASVENLSGGSANDDLTGDGGPNVLEGGDGGDDLDGAGGNDTVRGEVGDDVLDQGADPDGADSLDGGPGDRDRVTYGGRDGSVTVSLDNAAAPGNDGETNEQDNVQDTVEDITGGAAGDGITGSSAANVVRGGDGMDVIDGAGGADELHGDEADDQFLQGASPDGSDVIDGGAGTGDAVSYASRGARVAVTVGAGANDGDVSGAGERDDVQSTVEVLTGGNGADELSGDSSNESLNGGPGSDVLAGGPGADGLNGGGGTDVASYHDHAASVIADIGGAAGNDGGVEDGAAGARDTIDAATVESLVGGSGNDELSGDAAANRLEGGAGDDRLAGKAGADTLFGQDDTDVLTGGTGADELDGGSGASDTADYSDHANDVTADLDGSGGDDGSDEDGASGSRDTVGTSVENLTGGGGSDSLAGDDRINALTGGAGGDLLTGAGGNDNLAGDGGNDTVNGGDGQDTLSGGTEDDSLITRDAFADQGTCGAGTDAVTADVADSIASDCETVDRGITSGGGGTPQPPAPAPAPAPPPAPADFDGDGLPDTADCAPADGAKPARGGADLNCNGVVDVLESPADVTRPAIGVTIPRTVFLRTAGQVPVRVSCPVTERSCTGTVTLTTAGLVQVSVRRRVRLGSRGYRLAGGRSATIRVQLSPPNRALVRRLRRVRVRASVTARDAAGNRLTRTRFFTLASPR